MKMGDILILKEDVFLQNVNKLRNGFIELRFEKGQKFEVTNHIIGTTNNIIVVYIKSLDTGDIFYTENTEYFQSQEEYRDDKLNRLGI